MSNLSKFVLANERFATEYAVKLRQSANKIRSGHGATFSSRVRLCESDSYFTVVFLFCLLYFLLLFDVRFRWTKKSAQFRESGVDF